MPPPRAQNEPAPSRRYARACSAPCTRLTDGNTDLPANHRFLPQRRRECGSVPDGRRARMTLRVQGDASDTHALFAGELHLNDVASGAQNRLTYTPAPSNTVVLKWGGGSTGEVIPDLVEILIDDPRVNVLIWPRQSTFTAGGVQLCDTGVVVDDGYMAPGF